MAMNRKQKIAVVVGVVVVVLLVLFPPWRCGGESTGFRWYRSSHTMWREAPVQELRWVSTGQPMDPLSPSDLSELGRDPEQFELAQVGVENRRSRAAVDRLALNVLAGAVLALTVAAVVVLKERKG